MAKKHQGDPEPPWARTLRRLDQLKAHIPLEEAKKQRPIHGLRRESRSLILHPVLMRELEIAAGRKHMTIQRFLAVKLATEWNYDKDDV